MGLCVRLIEVSATSPVAQTRLDQLDRCKAASVREKSNGEIGKGAVYGGSYFVIVLNDIIVLNDV